MLCLFQNSMNFPWVAGTKFNDFFHDVFRFNIFQKLFMKFNDFSMILKQIGISIIFQELWEPWLLSALWIPILTTRDLEIIQELYIYIRKMIISVGLNNRPVAQIPQCTGPIAHNAPFCNRNVHMSVTKWCIVVHICLMHCGICEMGPGLILGLRPASDRRCYFVTTSLIGWVQAWNQPWGLLYSRSHFQHQQFSLPL